MSSSGIFPTDEWTIAEGETEAGLLLVRYRAGDPAPADQAIFQYLIIITWSFEPRDASGLPDSETLDQMEAFENCVLDKSDEDRVWGSGVAVITHAGTREWRFYTPDVEVFQGEFSTALSGFEPFPLQFLAFEDPEWTGFAEIRGMARG
ncbi:MAG: DUF695 domain-containing protein [Pseudomonadota bacterium]